MLVQAQIISHDSPIKNIDNQKEQNILLDFKRTAKVTLCPIQTDSGSCASCHPSLPNVRFIGLYNCTADWSRSAVWPGVLPDNVLRSRM